MSCRTQRLVVLGAVLAVGAACGSAKGPGGGLNPVQKVYDKQTGRLTRLSYDTNKNGRIDTECYMDGTRVVRIELDRDEDGKVERWEYYGPDQTLEKVGISRANDGKVDAWAFSAPDGSLARLDISASRDGKITRTEHYERGKLARAEEDGDGDGRIEKWETYNAGTLAAVALDTQHRGTPDRRLVYLPDGTVRTEKID